MSASGTKWLEIRPKKVWQVGDKTYDTYLEAVRALSENKNQSVFEAFRNTIDEAIREYSREQATPVNLANYLWARYLIKPRVK